MKWLVGPWVWDTTDEPHWRPPVGFAGLDLRAVPNQAMPGGAPKLSLFFGNAEPVENVSDYISLGRGSWVDLKPTAKQLALIPSRSGYTPSGDTLQAILFDLLCNGGDPHGFDCHKPLLPTSAMSLELHAGQKYAEPFAWGGKQTAMIRDVLRADFKNLYLATCDNPKLNTLPLKVLDAYCEKYRVPKADWREFVPVELQADVPGVLPHETTITENFDRANSTSVMGNNLTWTQVTGTWGTTSNKGYKVSTNAVTEWARAESDLSSADHYAQVLVGAAVDAFRFSGPACRFAAGAGTHYSTLNYWNTQYLVKHVAGARTDLSTAAHTYAAEVLKVQANGSTIKGYAAGSELMSVTDTAITGNTRTGLVSYGINETFESFQAADLTSSATVTGAGACHSVTVATAVAKSTKAAPGRSHAIAIPKSTGAATRSGIGRVVDLTNSRAVAVTAKAGAGRTTTLTADPAAAATIAAASGRVVDVATGTGTAAVAKANPGRSHTLSVPRASAASTNAAPARAVTLTNTAGTLSAFKAGPGAAITLSTVRGPGAAIAGGDGHAVTLTSFTAPAAAIRAAAGQVVTLADARAVAVKLARATGRVVCLTIARGTTSNGTTIEAREGIAVTLTVVRAIAAEPPYEWTRVPTGVSNVRARAAFRLEAFDFEDLEIYGTINTLTTLAGAALQFIGWDSAGEVAWDSNASPPTATAEVTNGPGRTYAATTTPKEAGVYKWQLRITNPGQQTVPVWGYLTITDSNAEIPNATIEKLTGE